MRKKDRIKRIRRRRAARKLAADGHVTQLQIWLRRKLMKKYMVSGVISCGPWILCSLAMLWVIDFFMDIGGVIVPLIPGLDGDAPAIVKLVMPLVFLVAIFTIIMIVGRFYYTRMGHRVSDMADKLGNWIPVYRYLYKVVSQAFKRFFGGGPKFKEVVVVDYPSKDSLVYAFVATRFHAAGIEWVQCYIPTAPNPTSGFAILKPAEDVFLTDVSVDQVLELTLVCGVVLPGSIEDGEDRLFDELREAGRFDRLVKDSEEAPPE